MKRYRKKGRTRRALLYPFVGALLSFTAPVGWLLLQLGTPNYQAARAELHTQSILYAYMELGAFLMLTLCGAALGWRDDRIHRQYQKMLGQQRLLARKNRQLARLSITDRLTGLANYFRLHEVLETEYKRAQRYQQNLCVLLVDIDHFKKINDTHGHLFGDFVLHELGQIFATTRRESDYVARTGGEEFCFILTQTPVDDALKFADRLRESVAHHTFEYKGMRSHVTLSAGVASIYDLLPDDQDLTGKTLLGLADEALYLAKRLGRNRVERYRPKPVGMSAKA